MITGSPASVFPTVIISATVSVPVNVRHEDKSVSVSPGHPPTSLEQSSSSLCDWVQATLVVSWPSLPRSHTLIVPFSDRVYRMFLGKAF